MNLSYCPRCGEAAYEVLKTHAYCINCNFSPDYTDPEPAIPIWALKVTELLTSTQMETSHAKTF